MKNLFGCMLVVIIMFTACEGPAGPPGKNGKDGLADWFVGDFVVKSEDWKMYDDEEWYFFEYEFTLPELTKFVFELGAVMCYLVQDVSYDGGKTEYRYHSLLPYTVYGEDSFIDENNDEFWYPYSENYSFEYRQGNINFVVKYSDWVPNLKPPTRQFHVVIMW